MPGTMPCVLMGQAIKKIKMKKVNVLLLTVLFAANVQAQVGLNGDGSAPDHSAMLDVKSTTKGFLVPRMTAAQRTAISSPATGLLIYQTDDVIGYWYNQGSGETSVWKHLSGDEPDGSETKVTAGAHITITGIGTSASPYVVNASVAYGDVKQGFQLADHNGWVKLDGRSTSSLSSTQQTQAAALGIGANLPDASNSFMVQNGTTLGSVSGSNTVSIARNQLPNVNFTGSIERIAHGSSTGAIASGVFSTSSSGYLGNATGGGQTDAFYLNIHLNGGVTQQPINITPRSLSVNAFVFLGL